MKGERERESKREREAIAAAAAEPVVASADCSRGYTFHTHTDRRADCLNTVHYQLVL